jgi:hypothetical protein
MSNSIRTSALGMAAAVATAPITLTSAPAQAAGCHAPVGESCLRITNHTKQIRGRHCESNTRFDGWTGTFDGPDSLNFNNP